MRRTDKERLAACDQHAPYIDLATKIAREVAAFDLKGEAATNPSGVMELLTSDLTNREIRSLVKQQFDTLPAATRAQILASTFPGDAAM